MNWNNAGAAALLRLDFRDALPDFLKARSIAENSQLRSAFRVTLNNMAALYLQMNDAEASLRVASEALAGGDSRDDPVTSSKLRYQQATALARLHRFDEAAPIFRRVIGETLERDDFETATRMLGNFGGDCLAAGKLDDAEEVLSHALLLVRLHHIDSPANVLRALGKLKSRRGDVRAAAAFFDAAIQAPPGTMPRHVIYADRGEFRLKENDLAGALSDFREARRIAAQMRADVVPADRDRITLEGGLSRMAAGLVDAGNRLAQETPASSPMRQALMRETFDAAEQDREWSLRSLLATPNDWRTRLPERYGDLLAQYQAIERDGVANPSAEQASRAALLEMELQKIEAATAGRVRGGPGATESALAHARGVLDADSVLLSFHIAEGRGWLWAVDRSRVAVYSILRVETLKPEIAGFVKATKNGEPDAAARGRQLYEHLFGKVPPRYLAHERWLLELDGPLFDLPFGALMPGTQSGSTGLGSPSRKGEPVWLSQRVVLETIPGALMLQPRATFTDGAFLGIGDPIYNEADARYRGSRQKQEIVLPRLPATAAELQACARTWNPAKSRILTGADADLRGVRAALNSNPAVIHFATHVIPAQGSYSSGLIALGLDNTGVMGLMGPAEIVARPAAPGLVVLDGCHSAQGDTLPGTGLMGLTRAWLAAGAHSVLATHWDVPDEGASKMMVAFYEALRAHPERGPDAALQQAQRSVQDSGRAQGNPAVWAAYFVTGRE